MLSLFEIAALLRHFDSTLLLAVAQTNQAAIDQLLADERIEPVAGYSGRYQVRRDSHATELASVRANRLADVVALHRAAFDYYLARLHDRPVLSDDDFDVDACVYHLFNVFVNYPITGEQVVWRPFLDWVAAVRATGLTRPHHRRQLDLIEGYTFIRVHDYPRGEPLLTTLLAELDTPTSLPDELLMLTVKGLADAAYFKAQHEQARALYRRLYELALAANQAVYQGLALLNQGLICHELDDNTLALTFCEQSLVVFRATGDRRREVQALYHLALYSLYCGDWQSARHHGLAAEQLFIELAMTSYLGHVAWLQGRAALCLGELAASERFFRRALDLARGVASLTLSLDTHTSLGILCHLQDQPAAARDHFEHALALASEHQQPHRACFIHYHLGRLNQYLDDVDGAFAAYASAIDGIETLRQASSSADIKIGLVGTVQQLYEGMVLLCLETDRPAEAFHYAERARQQALLDALAKEHTADIAPHTGQAATLAEVQATLPPDALLLAYFTIGTLPAGEHWLKQLPSQQTGLRSLLTHPPQTLLFAMDQTQLTVKSLPLDPNHLAPQPELRLPGRHLLNGRLPEFLYQQLIAPIAHLLVGRSVVTIVPHGPLHYLPFGALRDPDGRYLLDQHGPALAQSPSATLLLRQQARTLTTPPQSALTLGFNEPSGTAPLRFAEAEARHVAHMLRGQAHTGGAAGRDQLDTSTPVDVLHIAGHAHFDPDNPLDSALHLADGLLSAHELLQTYRLRPRLAFLNSCTSGTSRIVAGDEILGLQRAFLLNGVASVVCTRWEAIDVVALLVADQFYRVLLTGLSPAVALRDAVCQVRTLTRADIKTLTDRWMAESSPLAAMSADLLAIVNGPADMAPFANPNHWATYVLIGAS